MSVNCSSKYAAAAVSNFTQKQYHVRSFMITKIFVRTFTNIPKLPAIIIPSRIIIPDHRP